MKRTNLRLLEKVGSAGFILLFILSFQFSSIGQTVNLANAPLPFPALKDRVSAINAIDQEFQTYQSYKSGALNVGDPQSFMLRARILSRLRELAQSNASTTTSNCLTEVFFDTNIGYTTNQSINSFYAGIWPDEYKYVVNLLRR